LFCFGFVYCFLTKRFLHAYISKEKCASVQHTKKPFRLSESRSEVGRTGETERERDILVVTYILSFSSQQDRWSGG